jgi:hypothetical protein
MPAARFASPANDIEQALDRLRNAAGAGTGEIEVREEGMFQAELSPPQWELREQGANLVIHIWSGGRNLTRRVTGLLEAGPHSVTLEVRQFGRARAGKLEFRRREFARTEGRISREKFRAQFGRLLRERFPDARVESLTASPDLKHSLSGLYPRGLMTEAGRTWVFLGASLSESAAAVDGALAFGLIWLDYQRQRVLPRTIYGLRLILPSGGAAVTAQRSNGLDPGLHLEIFEFDASAETLKRVDVNDAGNLQYALPPRNEQEALLAAAGVDIAQIRNLVPEAIPAIEAAPLPGTNEVALRFRGLEFARWSGGTVQYGLGNSVRTLTREQLPDLAVMIRELIHCRSPKSAKTAHRLYRSAPERWLETCIIEAPDGLDASLDGRFLYSQVTSSAGADRGLVDLLGVTRRGRLVLIELKASEDIQLPIQALDYWLRVSRHHASGDFQRMGYFGGIDLDPRPPLLWLVAPGLQFHPSTGVLLGFATPDAEISQVGLNENWRQGLKVIFRL